MGPKTPEECDHRLGEHLAAGDVERILSLYEPGATLLSESGEPLIGHAAIRAMFAPLAAARPLLRPNLVMVARTGADLAVVYNDWTAMVTPPGGSAVEMGGKAVEVMRLQPDGTWRFLFDDPYARSR